MTDSEYDKIIGQYQLALNGVMNPLTMYGQGDYVAQAIPVLTSLAVQLHHKMCGVDMPYIVEKLH